jgi:hypothetical protein
MTLDLTMKIPEIKNLCDLVSFSMTWRCPARHPAQLTHQFYLLDVTTYDIKNESDV